MSMSSFFKEYLPTTTDKKFIKVEAYYSKGGMNYFNGASERRGYYLSVMPVERSNERGYTTESFMMFSGTKKLLLEVARQSPKAQDQAKALIDGSKDELVQYIVKKSNLVLAELENVES